DERLAGAEEDAAAVGRGTGEEGAEGAVAVDRALRDPRRRPARALVHVDSRVQVVARQLLARLEEDAAAVGGGTAEAGVPGAVAVDRALRDPRRRPARALVDIDARVRVAGHQLLPRVEEDAAAIGGSTDEVGAQG